MYIKKSDLKILRYIYRHKSVTYGAVTKKFRNFPDYSPHIRISSFTTQDESGFDTVHRCLDDAVTLTDSGIAEVESRQFFNLEYVLSSLVLPIIVGVLSSVITALILLFLG